MIHTFKLNCIPPSKKNSKRIAKRGKRSFILSSQRYCDWEKTATIELKSQYNGKPICRCHVAIAFYIADNRARDLTNLAEGVLDAMVLAGILWDDNYKVVEMVSLRYIKADESKVNITVFDMYN